MTKWFAIAVPLALALACHNAKNTVIPQDAAALDGIQPAMEKLGREDRELLDRYLSRHSGLAGPKIPEGTTIGGAIADQKKHEEGQRQSAEAEGGNASLEAREAAMKALRQAVAVNLVSKKIVTKRGPWGSVDEYLETAWKYQNNTGKDMAGFKGTIRVIDAFGKEIASYTKRHEETLAAGKTVESSETGSFNSWNWGEPDKLRRFAVMGEDQYKVFWEPSMVIFADGSKLTIDRYKSVDAAWEAAMNVVRQAVTVNLASKKLVTKRGSYGSVDESFEMAGNYQNNTAKDIVGFKGKLSFVDQFGDSIHSFDIAHEKTIAAGKAAEWSKTDGVKGDNLRRFDTMKEDRFKVIWTPQIIVFADGTKLVAPQS